MKLLEFITGSKKICHACHEAFYVEPLACPKCGAKVKTHKAEKWGAVIGAFIGICNGCSGLCKDFEQLIVDPDCGSQLLQSLNELLNVVDTPERLACMFVISFWFVVILWGLIGFIAALVIKKIFLAVRTKKARQ